jgi:hypothetical protein
VEGVARGRGDGGELARDPLYFGPDQDATNDEVYLTILGLVLSLALAVLLSGAFEVH